MNRTLSLKALVFILATLNCFTSCSTDDVKSTNQLTNITVRLKSTVGELSKVFIDIEDVELRVKDKNSESDIWMSLNTTNMGIHNACDLDEDLGLLLVDNYEVESTSLYEIRLVLGHNNFMDVNNILLSLDVADLGNATPSNIVNTELVANRFYDFIIHVDIDKSISFNEDEDMMVLNPEIYTEIRQIKY